MALQSFYLFSSLPIELQTKVWDEEAIPQPDARFVHYNTHFMDEVFLYNIEEMTNERSSEYPNLWAAALCREIGEALCREMQVDNPNETTMSMLGTCRLARRSTLEAWRRKFERIDEGGIPEETVGIKRRLLEELDRLIEEVRERM